MKKKLQISNGIAFVVMIFINYLSNTGLVNNNTNATVSRAYENLFTPAGYAFSIWGIIYLLTLGFVIYQGLGLFNKTKDNDLSTKVGWWFVVSCVANSLWLFAWLYEYLLIALVIMLILLFALLKIIFKTGAQITTQSFEMRFFVWLPFSIYAGWITVATIANSAALLKQVGWDGFGLSDTFWTVSMIVIAGFINLLVSWKRNMSVFAIVGVWALVAIAVANHEVNLDVVYSSLMVAVVLLISCALLFFKNWQARTTKI
jgi:hypothetical protein